MPATPRGGEDRHQRRLRQGVFLRRPAHVDLASRRRRRRAGSRSAPSDDPKRVAARVDPVIVPAIEREMTARGFARVARRRRSATCTTTCWRPSNQMAQTHGQFLPATPVWGLPPFAPSTSALSDLSGRHADHRPRRRRRRDEIVWRGVRAAQDRSRAAGRASAARCWSAPFATSSRSFRPRNDRREGRTISRMRPETPDVAAARYGLFVDGFDSDADRSRHSARGTGRARARHRVIRRHSARRRR